MLACEHFGWRHNGGLAPVLRRAYCRKSGDHGFPRADIALEEPVHGAAFLKVLQDLPERPFLRSGQRERKFCDDPLEEGNIGFDLDRARPRELHFLSEVFKLEQKQVLERKAPFRGERVLDPFREMNVLERVMQFGEAVHAERGAGQPFRRSREPLEDRLYEVADPFRGKAARLRVDGHEAGGMPGFIARIPGNGFERGVAEVELVLRDGDFAGKISEPPGPENVLDIGLVEPDDAGGAGVVTDSRLDYDEVFLPCPPRRYLFHRPLDGRV